MSFKESDSVRLKRSMTVEWDDEMVELPIGALGAVILIGEKRDKDNNPVSYLVDFSGDGGQPLAMVSIPADALMLCEQELKSRHSGEVA